MISIIIPTFNNLDYLKLAIKSIEKNSNLENEIILHVNEGNDGTLDYVKKNNYKYSYSKINNGICIGCNKAALISKYDLILYAHDDMYFCPDWDKFLIEEVEKLNTKLFYFSSTMINGDRKLNGHLNFYAGETFKTFDEFKLLKNFKNLVCNDFQGSTWAPHLIHKEVWNKVGGFSVEFSPGTGSDPDLNMKLWKLGVRIFKGVNKSRVYHFGSVVTRQKEKKFFTITDTGNKGNKIFLKKWGISIKFFKKYYLRSDTIYNGKLDEPKKTIKYFIDLIKVKLTYFYILLFYKI
jgi:glycosyltransferase involved in cell wall biosynthesis